MAQRAVAALRSLPGLRLVSVEDAVVQQAADLAARLGLRGAGVFYMTVAARLEVPLVTLDRDQCQRATRIVTVEEVSIMMKDLPPRGTCQFGEMGL